MPTNNKTQNTDNTDLNEKKIKLMAIRLSAFQEEERPSYFEQLENGALRRAVEREAAFNVNAYRSSNSYAKQLNEKDINTLYHAHIEYYAKMILDNRNRSNYIPGEINSFEYDLMERDSRATKNYEDTPYEIKEGGIVTKTSITQNKIASRAKSIDDKTTAQNKDVAEHIQKMKMMQEIRVYH